MRKTILIQSLIAQICFLLIGSDSSAQIAADISCQQYIFYGSIGTGVHELELNSGAGTVTDLGIIAPSPIFPLSNVAYANDITQNSTNRTLYSSSNTGNGTSTILRWTGLAWDSITTDTILYYNSAGYGSHVYFQRAGSGGINDLCISRLNANGTLTPIFLDTTLVFSVADMAVDTSGNIYCFRGTSIGNTTELTVLDSTGSIINSFSTTLNHLSVFFGMMFINDTLYLGQSTTNSQLFPVIFSGSTVSLGTPIPMNIPMSDLANCHLTREEILGVRETVISDFVTAELNYFTGLLEINNQSNGILHSFVYDLSGRLISSVDLQSGQTVIYTRNWNTGMYQLMFTSADGRKFFKKIAVI